MSLFETLPVAASTMWADACKAAQAAADYKGLSPIRKLIGNKTYWYAQGNNPDGSRSQHYIGLDSDPGTQSEVSRLKTLKNHHRRAKELAQACIVLGGYSVAPQHMKILRAIAASNFFEAGGILGGTHAFLAYQNHLGVRWSSGSTTMDVDFIAPSKSILLKGDPNSVATTYQAIASLDMGFVERQALAGFVKANEPEFEIDMLTTISRELPPGSDPGAAAGFEGRYLPLKFMELAFRSPITTFALSGSGLLKIRVPSPSDFAVHKLIVAQERVAKDPLKARKDLTQSACILAALDQIDADSLEDSFQDALSRGKGWRSRIIQSCSRIQALHPEVAKIVDRMLEDSSTPPPERLRG